MQKQILLADDEPRIRAVSRYALEREGLRVLESGDGLSAVAAVERGGIDAVVLDVMLPELDGLEVCRRIRALPMPLARTPVLFLSARGEELDRIVGLELGGDDYLAKPFSVRELTARVRALLRRAEPLPSVPTDEAHRKLRHAAVCIDLERHELRCGGELVSLTSTELALLVALYERPGIVLTRAQLVQRAARDEEGATERSIDTHVRRIRAKFRAHGVDPIGTVHGVGYRAGEG
jgi:two-component system, OmpR family, response regulator